MPKLVYSTTTGKLIEYNVKSFNTIGRHPNQDVQILDRIVSKEHAEIFRSDTGAFYLRDIGSRNGTILNGEKIGNQPVKLKNGDEITFGAYILRFVDDPETAEYTIPSNSIPIRTEQSSTSSIRHKMNSSDTNFLPESKVTNVYDLRRDYEKLRIAYELSRETSLEFNLDKLLSMIVDKAFQVFSADRAIILLKTENGTMEPRLVRDNRGRDLRDFRISQTILDEVVNEKTAILSSDALFDARFSSSESIIFDSVRSAMCVPLLYGDELLGVINLDTQFVTGAFTEKDLQILTGFARQAAFNIKHSQLIHEMEENIIARDKLSRILSPHLVNDVLNGKLELTKSGNRCNATVLFCDIRGFTSMSEKNSSEDIVYMLNEFFELMVEIIFKHEGVLDKFMGDEVMAVWGVPVAKELHALSAVRCALEMQEGLQRLNAHRLFLNQGGISIGIGIATGEMIAGYMGSTQAMSYTVIGNTVNTGARLCSAASPGEILINEDTFMEVKEQIACTSLPPMRFKGKAAEINVFRVDGYSQPDKPSSMNVKAVNRQ